MVRMHLSERSGHALHALAELAASGGGLVTSEQLARTQAIPAKVLEVVMTELRRAGLVRSQRGPDGGFCLARPAAEISLADIIRAIRRL
jgi:Rrf2 family protein